MTTVVPVLGVTLPEDAHQYFLPRIYEGRRTVEQQEANSPVHSYEKNTAV